MELFFLKTSIVQTSKMNFKSIVIILISLTQALLFTQQVEAYCIYNKTNTKYVNLRQTSYHTTAPLLSLVNTIRVIKLKYVNNLICRLFLKSHVGPDSRECCPYTTTDCSSSKTKEEVLVMSVSIVIFE